MTGAVPFSLNRGARVTANRVVREYGMLTAALRGGPDFIIIGAKRGGSTSLYRYLLEHPHISPLFPRIQHIKRSRYFDLEFARGHRWYRSHFPLEIGHRHVMNVRVKDALAGEASPYYLFHPLAAERIATEYPNVKIIVILRDPVERAYSHFKERCKHGGEWLSFEDALRAEPERLRGEAERITKDQGYRSIHHEDHSYIAQGRYLDMLPRWLGLFPRENMHIAVSEEMYADPNRVANQIWTFLGLPPRTLQSRLRHNYIPAPDAAPQTRLRLEQEFADHNHDLECLIGRPLPWPGPRPAKHAVK